MLPFNGKRKHDGQQVEHHFEDVKAKLIIEEN